MNTDDMIIQTLDNRVKRREERRQFFRYAGGAAVAIGGASLLSACGGEGESGGAPNPPTPAPTPTPTPALTDADILNFALNLEYLEAQFYSYAAFGTGLAANLLTGTGTQGSVIGGQKVNFTDPVVAAYAKEIAQDEVAHVAFLRTALGGSAVAQPAIDVGGTDPNGAFSQAARSAGLVGAGVAFNPYATDEAFLLGAFIFEDVGVTAYKGAAPLITSKTFLEAAAGILAAEAYHAAIVRTTLYAKGIATGSTLRGATESISNARDTLDGSGDDDQGVTGTADTSNIVPTNSDGIVYSRSADKVLNIAYLTRLQVDRGGFFPNGVNGNIKVSAASG